MNAAYPVIRRSNVMVHELSTPHENKEPQPTQCDALHATEHTTISMLDVIVGVITGSHNCVLNSADRSLCPRTFTYLVRAIGLPAKLTRTYASMPGCNTRVTHAIQNVTQNANAVPGSKADPEQNER